MHTLRQQLSSYAAYHQDPRNKLTHFFGVPLVTYSIFLFLSWFRFAPAADVALMNGATLFYLCVFVYYLRLDAPVALLQVPFSLALLWLADWVSLWPFTTSVAVFAATFVGGWIIQLAGHALEGRRPALADNFMQIFNAPLFLIVELLHVFGTRLDLKPEPAGRVIPVMEEEVRQVEVRVS